jgi:hypothetical protein
LTLRLGGFANSAFEDHMRRTGTRPELVVRTAASYYLADRGAGRPSWLVARFESGVSAPEVSSITVELDDRTWNALAEEAARQRVAPARLAEHALLYFLADLDRGRAANPLGDVAQEDSP